VKYRLEFVHVSKINWFKWAFWLCEVVYIPLLANISWAGNCSFETKRKGVFIVECD